MVSRASDGNIDVRIFFACYLILISHLGRHCGSYCSVWIVESTFIKALVSCWMLFLLPEHGCGQLAWFHVLVMGI